MKFKLDENLPASSAAILETAGHDVDTVIGEGLTGALDPEVVAAATAAGRMVLGSTGSAEYRTLALRIIMGQRACSFAAGRPPEVPGRALDRCLGGHTAESGVG